MSLYQNYFILVPVESDVEMHKAIQLLFVGLLSTCIQCSTFHSCAKIIINQLYTDISYVMISSNLNVDTEWHKLIPPKPFIIINPEYKIFERGNQAKATTYIIFVDNSGDYEHYLKTVYLTSFWNPRAKFFIIDLGRITVSEIFEISLRYLALDVIVLSDDQVIYTYYPYHDGYCGNPKNYKQLGKCEDIIKGDGRVYKRELPKTYNKCPIRVGVFYITPYAMKNNSIRPDDPGIDILITREIARRTNLEVIIAEHEGNITQEYFGMMFKEVSDGKIDLLVGGIAVNSTYLTQFDVTKSHLSDIAAFYVPAAKAMNEEEIILNVFEGRIVMAMWISFHLVGVVFWMSSNLLGRPRGFERLYSSLWITLCITYLSSRRYHRLTKQRFLMFLWATTFFTLSAFLGCRLTSLYSTVPVGHHATTVKDFERYGLKYGGADYVRLALENLNDENVPPLANWVDCDESLDCTDRVAKDRDFAVFKTSRSITYNILSHYTDKNGRRMLKPLDKPKIFLRFWMVAKKGFPFLDRFNELLRMLSQSGLIAKWRYYSTAEPPITIGDNFRTMNRKSILVPIQMLIVGLVIGTIAFLVELRLKGRPFSSWGMLRLRRKRLKFLN